MDLTRPPTVEPKSSLHHSKRPRPGRRRRTAYSFPGPKALVPSITLSVVFLILCCATVAHASPPDAERRHVARGEDILFDRRHPPHPPALARRQQQQSSSTSSAPIAVASGSSGGLTSLPQPFDTSIGSNFTSQACPNFLEGFLANATFQNCHPLSLLLQVRCPADFFYYAVSFVLTLIVDFERLLPGLAIDS